MNCEELPVQFEHHREPLAPLSRFVRRLISSFAAGLGLVAVSLAIGMIGYRRLFALSWIDAFVNASMILSGMGPVDAMHSVAGKRFAGLYALYSGIAFLAVAGLVFAPLLHRLLHHFHADEKDLNPDDDKESGKP